MEQLTEKKDKFNHTDFVNNNKTIIKKSEKYAVAIFVIGLLLRYWGVEGTNFVLAIGIIALTIVYFLTSLMTFEFDENDNLESNKSVGLILFFYKMTFLAAAISALSFFGLIIEIRNPSTIVIIAGLILAITLFGTLYLKSKNEIKAFDRVYYLRIVIIIALLAILSIFKYNII